MARKGLAINQHLRRSGPGGPHRWARLSALLAVFVAGIAVAFSLPAAGGASGPDAQSAAQSKLCKSAHRALSRARSHHAKPKRIAALKRAVVRDCAGPKQGPTTGTTTGPTTGTTTMPTCPGTRSASTRQCPAVEDICSDEYWADFDPTEESMDVYFFLCGEGSGQDRQAHAAVSSNPITAIKLIVPGGRQITNTLCPSQLPTATVSDTNSTKDTLTCSGGSVPLGTHVKMNVQTSPGPNKNMGGQVFGQQDGTFHGPFTIRAGP